MGLSEVALEPPHVPAGPPPPPWPHTPFILTTPVSLEALPRVVGEHRMCHVRAHCKGSEGGSDEPAAAAEVTVTAGAASAAATGHHCMRHVGAQCRDSRGSGGKGV